MNTDTTMRCEDVAPYLSAYADGELPEPLRSEVAEHVESCDACTATLARYATIDSMFAGMPRSAPPPEMLDRILAEVATEEAQTERQRLLRSTWGMNTVKRRISGLDMPLPQAPLPLHTRLTPRARWVSVAIPAIAALLLISVTLVTFRWLPNGSSIFPPSNQATPTPAPGAVTLTDTRNAVAAIQAQLAFKAVLPSYLPDGATLDNVSIGPRDTELAEHVLDIYWNISGSGQTIHLHEAPSRIGLPEYSSLSSTAQVAWQVSATPWRSVRTDTAPKNMAIAQRRAAVSIALDISTQVASPQGASGQTMLRLISLSMDSPYLVLPTAPDETSARIVPLQIADLVAHFTAVALNSNGAVAWREETYAAPCSSTADPCQVNTSYALGANGAILSSDIASGQRLLHLDQAQKTYSWLPLLPTAQGANLTNTALPKLFYLANTYLSTGILWYMGETNFRGQRVFNLLWTSAPNQTHVYVSTSTHQVIAVSVDSRAKLLSGGPIAGTGPLSCLRYTMVEYIAPTSTTDALFAQTIPTGYTESQDSQISLSC